MIGKKELLFTPFSRKNKKIYFASMATYFSMVEYLKNFPWTKEPPKEDFENYCCYIYVLFYVKYVKPEMPFSISKVDPPDFVFESNDMTFGLEQTNATTKSYKHASHIFYGQYPPGSFIELSEYWNDHTSKDTVRLGLKKPNEPLTGIGWGDNGQENIWIECIYAAISKKTVCLRETYHTVCAKNELIIYDDTPTGYPDLEYAIPKLKEKYGKEDNKEKLQYDKIHIITRESLFYDVFGKYYCSNISKGSLDSYAK
jgi:hypothetical protein